MTMAYLPLDVPEPLADDGIAAFWDHCRQRRLCFQRCEDCGLHTHPPLPVCPRCRSMRRGWAEAPQEGRVFSFVWAHTAAHPALAGQPLPYNLVVVEFPALPGVRLVSNVMGVAEGGLRIGDPLRLQWDEREGMPLPRFRPG